jgi:signal transduction histidine kinase
MSLRRRLILSAAYLLTVVVIALEVPLAITISRRTLGDFQAGVLQNAALVSARLNDDVAALASQIPPADRANRLAFVQQVVDEAARRVGARVIVVDGQGRLLGDSAREAPVGTLYMTTGRPELQVAVVGGRVSTLRRFSASLGQELLLVTVPIVHNRASIGAVRVSELLGDIQARVHRTWLGLGVIGLAVVLVGLALAWLLATTLTRPVARLEEAAAQLGAGDLSARAEPSGPKEIASLARSFDQMADALSANLLAQRDFLANASHQLRTPLTGLKLRLEAIEQEGGFAADQAKKAGAEVDRLGDLVNDLLELARAASAKPSGSVLDLRDVAKGAVERWTGPAEEAGQRLELDVGDGAQTVWADAADLGHALDNLIENSIRYSPAETVVSVGVSRNDGRPSLTVADTGPGIPAEDRTRIFERFYRGSAGTRAGPGTGLGLAIVVELVNRWGGEIHLDPGPATCIQATFPAHPGGGVRATAGRPAEP